MDSARASSLSPPWTPRQGAQPLLPVAFLLLRLADRSRGFLLPLRLWLPLSPSHGRYGPARGPLRRAGAPLAMAAAATTSCVRAQPARFFSSAATAWTQALPSIPASGSLSHAPAECDGKEKREQESLTGRSHVSMAVGRSLGGLRLGATAGVEAQI